MIEEWEAVVFSQYDVHIYCRERRSSMGFFIFFIQGCEKWIGDVYTVRI